MYSIFAIKKIKYIKHNWKWSISEDPNLEQKSCVCVSIIFYLAEDQGSFEWMIPVHHRRRAQTTNPDDKCTQHSDRIQNMGGRRLPPVNLSIRRWSLKPKNLQALQALQALQKTGFGSASGFFAALALQALQKPGFCRFLQRLQVFRFQGSSADIQVDRG